MKTKTHNRLAAVFMALAMLLSLIPFEAFVRTTARAENKTYVLDVGADMEVDETGKMSDKTLGTDGFFLLHAGSAKVNSNEKTFGTDLGCPVAYKGTKRLNFGGAMDEANPAKQHSLEFTTTANNATLEVWWISNKADRDIFVLGENGTKYTNPNPPASANELKYTTFTLATAQKYYLGNSNGGNYFFKVAVTDAEAAPAERGSWADVALPEIDTISASGSEITVSVNANVGTNGGDEVVVTMHDSTGKQVETKSSFAKTTSHSLTFKPTASGTYTFKATLSRKDESSKKNAAENKTFQFKLPLAKPVISSATNKGNGSLEIKWGAVAEADKYKVYVNDVEKGETTSLSSTITGLATGTCTINVEAIRGTDKKKSENFSATVKNEVEREWTKIYYGASTGSSKNKVEGSLNADGKITITASGGKIDQSNYHGVTYYYTPVPNNMNFTLRGKFTVNSWTFSNGQEGFGILAMDRTPVSPNTTSAHWTNEYMMGVMKTEYTWDPTTGKVIYDGSGGDKYTMKQGVGILTKSGITPANLAEIEKGNTALQTEVAPSTTYPLETTATSKDPGTYNIVGSATNAPISGSFGTLKTEFIFELQRNNTGYFMTYYAEDGTTVIGQQKFYDPNALSSLDKDNVYVGFFAARNFEVVVSDVTLTTIDPAQDSPAEKRPVEKITPTISITSAKVANNTDYALMLNANVAGTADITINGKSVGTGFLAANSLFSKALELDRESNKITVVFKPDPNQTLGVAQELENTDPVTAEITVTYNSRLSEQKNLYVSPNGKKTGNGGKDYPLDIYTAVSVVRPGQTIILMDGRYILTSPVRIERGMDGTASAKIRMIADPEAKTRPVLDFNKTCEGVRLGGSYWYVQGFDVTNTGNGLAGFRVCGNYNTLDRIDAYNNGNTGIQISAYRDSADPRYLWPHDNLILNCTSYNNADNGYEDADGFAAKLTIGEGNVFDGCAAYNNADDGWDLFAKASTGSIGAVTIKNCIAYNNGFLLDGTNAGNGNGFKLGGGNLPGGHKLINSFAFNNKANGITCNSCPDIQVTNCTSYNNGGKNLTLYCNNNNASTNFKVNGVVSSKGGVADDIKKTATDSGTEVINHKTNVDPSAFVSTDFGGLERNADGTLDLGDFLKLKDAAAGGADFDKEGGSTSSGDVGEITPDENLPAPKPESSGSSGFPSSSGTSDSPSSSDDSSLTFEDDDTEIKVTAPSGAFDNDVKFNAVPITAETNDRTFTFDLSFTDKDGNKVQPKVAVIVKIPVPTALVGKTIYVYHVENDGSYTEINCKVEDGMVVFTASSFSKYIITTEKLVTSNSNPNPNTGVQSHGGLVFTIAGLAAVCSFKRKRRL